MHGYGTTAYHSAACAAQRDLAIPRPVNCAGRFPWISGSLEQTPVIFGTQGVEFSYTATVRGHYPVKSGAVAEPLEVREMVLRLHGDQLAETHPVFQAALKCGQPVKGLPFKVSRATARSFAEDTEIPAIVAAIEGKIIWLEFDEKGWPEAEYLRVLKLAVSDAKAL